jgi:CheY-like chemotaxis protein
MKKKLIILAEDDADDRMIFSDAFEEFNDGTLELKILEDGREVIEFLKTIDSDSDLPHLFIFDQNMPRMTGRETLGILKQLERCKHIPVIIYTTYSDKKLVHDFEESGAGMVVSKPDTYDGFKEMVHTFLSTYVTNRA